jgi:hypothetical protein
MPLSTTRVRTRHYGKARSRNRTRSRSKVTGVQGDWTPLSTTEPYSLNGVQTTVSEEHHWPPPKGGFQGDVGGEFSSVNQHATLGGGRPWYARQESAFWIDEFLCEDSFTPIPLTGGKPVWPTSLQSTDVDLDARGATAVAQCKPTRASSNLLVALGEVYRDGLPALIGQRTWRDRTLAARNAGDEYLNKEFGWDPLISDITSFGDTVRNGHQLVSQYERDMGNLVRRRRNLPSESSTTTTIQGTNQAPVSMAFGSPPPGPGNAGVLQTGTLFRIEKTLKERWFSGAFSYGIPLNSTGLDGMAEHAGLADRLFGLSLTPDALWQLAPWSWAVDWFTNTGDVLSNISDAVTQGLVMHYGYMMEHTVHSYTYVLEGCTRDGQPFRPPPVELVTETKRRRRANPFGFGVTWDGLSPFQLAIAAALGITRL